ncbi:UPF0389 protein [Homarus americanus]|uniref:UPF0389 protein n=1 Tax=Homarus americanus TaxID=6706 RepID=A0A8J5MX17_HOMAM|nr:UPF0389 protein [Homarus americanus]
MVDQLLMLSVASVDGSYCCEDVALLHLSSVQTTSTKAIFTKLPSICRLTDHRVNKFEKYLLVWGGKYKTVQEVPDLVNQDVLERARNKARIKINIMMCVATLLSCLAMVYAGKRAQKRGESVIKMNEDWHKKYNEEAKIAQAKADHASN